MALDKTETVRFDALLKVLASTSKYKYDFILV